MRVWFWAVFSSSFSQSLSLVKLLRRRCGLLLSFLEGGPFLVASPHSNSDSLSACSSILLRLLTCSVRSKYSRRVSPEYFKVQVLQTKSRVSAVCLGSPSTSPSYKIYCIALQLILKQLQWLVNQPFQSITPISHASAFSPKVQPYLPYPLLKETLWVRTPPFAQGQREPEFIIAFGYEQIRINCMASLLIVVRIILLNIGNMIVRVIVITLFATITLAIAAPRTAPIQPQLDGSFAVPYNLGFPDFQGACVTEDMSNKIAQIINQASQYEGDNVSNNLRYIKQQIDIRFGSLTQEFYVHIQLKNQSGFFNVLTSDKCTILGLRAGVNSLQPQWSYLIYKGKKAKTGFFYEDGTGKGSGVSPQQLFYFTHTIQSIEPKSACDCGSTAGIWKAFYDNDGKSWNLICSKSYSTRLYIAVEAEQYATVAFNCVYHIYASYTSP